GPAGEKGAAQAAYFGKRVVLVERSPHLGGAGINTGTIPSKTLRETALYFSGLRQRGLYGIDYSLRDGLTIQEFMYRERLVVENEWRIIARNLDRHGIEVVHGEATLESPTAVRVQLAAGGERRLTTRVILLATGSSPHHPPDVPFEHPRIHDSDSILHLDRIPSTLAVVGGGVIGVEYASIFTALGVQVTLIESRDRLVPFVDAEIGARLQGRLAGLGLRFVMGTRVSRIAPDPAGVTLTLSTGEEVRTDVALFAAGRQSNIAGLGLEALGVRLGNRGLVLVDEQYRTSVTGIYAAGDVIGFPALASTAMDQARVAMVHAFDLGYKERMASVIPLAVYSIPELALVGLTEEACRQQGRPYLVGRAGYDKSPRGQIIGDTDGLLKLIFDPADKRLLGVHLIGEQASELIHLGAMVMSTGGTIDAFIDAVFNYPTLTDSYKYAAYDGLGALRASGAVRSA
ncbi:MAG TPA: Si-specific NAD(P)(+) transhydrogenase, partial [Gemmatimonadales bacterium]|nr:Si-specific NAD(P)(+) transhydrogenase [Gemmatimonadales bacterium]